ncbi:MAG: Bug family tripartite tricarboxylate transporter substrate binding protein [Burkholderiales bacterium]
MRILHAIAALALVSVVHAQTGTPIRIIVPFAPGGGQDILARSFNGELGAALGQPVIVEYRAGGGGGVGTAYVAKAEPDGTTLIMSAASHIISAVLTSNSAYHPIKDFAAVAHVGTGSQILMVNAQLPVKSVADFVKYVKANPGKFNYGSAGSGSSTHLAMAYFANAAGLEIAHIPYKSNADQTSELLSGRIQAIMIPSIGAMPLAKEPRVTLLAVSPATRSIFFPQLPTIAESGYPGFNYGSWFGLLGPAAMPRAATERINGEMAKLLKTPLIAERLNKIGIEAMAMSSPQFEKLLIEDLERVERIVKISGARAE